jgi:hypothetical protein
VIRRYPLRARLATAVLAVAVLTLTSCGIPDGGKPIVDGNALATTSQAGSGGTPPRVDPSVYTEGQPVTFVEDYYLAAEAGQASSSGQIQAAQAFMAPGSTWKPPVVTKEVPSPVDVIRVIGSPTLTQLASSGYEITLSVQVVGVFSPQTGAVSSEAATARPKRLTFRVVSVSNKGLRLSMAPPGLYMTDDAMHNEYSARTIYFWSQDRELVPDLRYLPNWMNGRQRATTVVNWILAGPPPWLSLDNGGLVQDVNLVDSTVPTDPNDPETYIVNLTSTTMSQQDQNDLVAQIQWSLIGINPDQETDEKVAVDLKIANRQMLDGGTEDFLRENQAWERDGPIPYVVDNGKVRMVPNLPGTVKPLPVPPGFDSILDDPANSGVQLAALRSSAQQTDAALVRSDGARLGLWISRLRAKDGGEPKYVQVGLTGTTFARPVWINAEPEGTLAVVADGRFDLVDSNNTVIPLSVPSLGAITAFSVNSDGHQIALVSGGRVYVGMLVITGRPGIVELRPVNLEPALDNATAIAWSAVNQLIIGGKKGSDARTIETYSNGCFVNGDKGTDLYGVVRDWNNTSILQVVSYPPDPSTDTAPSRVMVQTSIGSSFGRASDSRIVGTSPFFPD